MTPIDFWFDFSSPYSYIASEWVEAVAARQGRSVRGHAMLLGATFQVTDIKSPVSYPLKREYSLRDFERSARFEGLPPLQLPARFPLATQNAARLFWWLHDSAREADAVAWARQVFRAVFQQGAQIDEVPALQAVVAQAGLDVAEAEAVWNDARWKLRLKQVNEEAIAAGIFGAPFFVIDGEPFWGNDRRGQMQRWLAGPF